MKGVVFYFEVHQPRRLRPYRMNEVGKSHDYFWETKNKEIFLRAADRCYIPATKLFIDNEIRASFSLSGTFIEQALEYRPDVIDVFKEYFKLGLGELMAETYYHSLASLWNRDEFFEQIREQEELLWKIFQIRPKTFRNTELIYSDTISQYVSALGYKNILAEGTDQIISEHTPNAIHKTTSGLNLFLRNYKLSDDISFRFSNWGWNEYPLTADKYAKWLDESQGKVANVFMDYETFGEHQVAETGIFKFLQRLPIELKRRGIEMLTVNEAAELYEGEDTISVNKAISWADTDRDISPWLGNEMQRDAFAAMQRLSNNSNKSQWRHFQTSDIIYYMSTGISPDQIVHEYFNPYKSPYYAFLSYMSILEDFAGEYLSIG
ncbi:MAG: glycoside hydrolase family 57 protein [Thermoplasmatales archaeon]